MRGLERRETVRGSPVCRRSFGNRTADTNPEGGCGLRPSEDWRARVYARTSVVLQKSIGDAWPQISSRVHPKKGTQLE